jgi:hypothetical protein
MSVLVRFGKQKAILRLGRWVSADKAVEARLNEATVEWVRQTGGPPLSHPNHELAAAQVIATRLGGRIVLKVNPKSKRAARIWVQQRQMRLF